jgi:N-glycosidase YbiA
MERFPFSNFQPARVRDELGIEYPTLEHYFQAAKTLDPAERRTVAALATPGRAKRAGRTLTLRPDWESVKRDVMLAGLKQKFTPGSEHAHNLLATGDEPITELNYWHDRYWGICACPTCGETGENHLGRLLERVRTELRGISR